MGETSLLNNGHAHFCLVDFGNGCFVDAPRSGRGTCQYKPPEVILGAGYGTVADIWSLGCMLFEAAVGSYLFDPRYVGRRRRGCMRVLPDGSLPDDIPRDEEHLAQIAEVFGRIPEGLIRRGRKTKEFLLKKPSTFIDGCEERSVWALRSSRIELDDRPRGGGLLARVGRSKLDHAIVDELTTKLAQLLQVEPNVRPTAELLL